MIEVKRASASRIVCVFLVCLSGSWLHADGLTADPNEPEPDSDVVIELTRFEITRETLELAYDIRNDSNDDVWVCADIDVNREPNFARCLADAGRTITLRRRADAPSCVSYEWGLSSRFVRLRNGSTRTETQSVSLPIFNPNPVDAGLADWEAEVARRLVVEIGYYPREALALSGSGRGGFDLNAEEFYRDMFNYPPAPHEYARVLTMAIDSVRLPFEMGDDESYPVYSDLLAQWFPLARVVVIQAKTNCFNSCQAGDFVRSHLEDLREDTIRDYNRKDGTSIGLELQLIEDVNVVLITDDEFEEIFQGSDGWGIFYGRYPGSPGLSELSCAGFSDDHTQALVYMGTQSHWLAGAGYVCLLEWNGSAWEIRDSIMVWIS